MLHKPKLFQVCLSLLLIWLAACNGGSQGGVSPAVVSTEETVQEEISVRFDLSDDPGSRWQEITLTVTDQEGNPLANQQVQYSQKDLDFLFSIEYGGMDPEMFANEGYADLFWDLGINAFQLSPYHLWFMFEPNDDDFRWWVEYEPPSFCPEVAVGETEVCPQESVEYPMYNYKLPAERKPFIKGIAWVGMYFYEHENNCENRNPDFLDCNDLDGQYRAEYEEFLAAFVEHYKDQISLYRLGLEVNFGTFTGGAEDKDMDWSADWIKMQCEIIKRIDPGARISVDLLDWRTQSSTVDDYNDSLHSQGIQSLAMYEDEFIELLIEKDVQFDVIGIELHPGYMISFESAEAELVMLEEFGKPIYVWENFVPSGEDDLIALQSCANNGTCPAEGYSEEYQASALLRYMHMLIEEHPSVIGLEYLGFRDNRDLLEPLPGPRDPEVTVSHGWVTENAEPKLIYHTIRDYWYGLFTDGSAVTDENGQISFQAIPGWFEITIAGESINMEIIGEHAGSEFSF